MNEFEKIKGKVMEFVRQSKTKTIKLLEIYKLLNLEYNQQTDKLIYDVLNSLVEDNIIEPIKVSKTNNIGSYNKYKIVEHKNSNAKNIQNEIIDTLVQPIDIQYLLKNVDEYLANKEFICLINQFLKNHDNTILTVNERSYQIFKNEKLLKLNEKFLTKLKLNFEDLLCYDTYEPFFYYQNPFFKGDKKTILIIENKDTFWTLKEVLDNTSLYKDVFLLIYGEGKKILNSFNFIENFKLIDKSKYEIKYFGDIDYEGINIYILLKSKFPNYNIKIFKEGYESILDVENNPQNIRTKQNVNTDYIQCFLKEFDDKYKQKLNNIFNNNKYIPQEVFNFNVICNTKK